MMHINLLIQNRYSVKSSAFTMIELIFVIVILGVLSVIAIPRFIGVSEEAYSNMCQAAIGSMNRTVGLNLWSKSLSEGQNGNISNYLDASAMIKNLPDYNVTQCGVIIGLTAGAVAAGDGIYGSPRLLNEGNMTNAPQWEWVKK